MLNYVQRTNCLLEIAYVITYKAQFTVQTGDGMPVVSPSASVTVKAAQAFDHWFGVE